MNKEDATKSILSTTRLTQLVEGNRLSTVARSKSPVNRGNKSGGNNEDYLPQFSSATPDPSKSNEFVLNYMN